MWWLECLAETWLKTKLYDVNKYIRNTSPTRKYVRRAASTKKGFEGMSEGETLMLKKKSTEISFEKKMADKSGKGFILTTKSYKIVNYAALLATEKRNME